MCEKFVVEVQQTDDGEGFIEIPSTILNDLDLNEFDTLLWERLDDGSGFYLEKKL